MDEGVSGSVEVGVLGLITDHELQLEAYLRFARFKREQHLKEVGMLFKDAGQLRTEDLVYTRANVMDLLTDVAEEVQMTLEKELQHFSHCTALLLRLLFEQAEEAGFEMSADLNKLENMTLLAEMKRCEQASLQKPASAYAKLQGRKLTKISGTGTDARIVMERDTLRHEAAALNDKLRILSAQKRGVEKEKEAAMEDARQLRHKLTASSALADAKDSQLAECVKELEDLKRKVGDMGSHCDALESHNSSLKQQQQQHSSLMDQTEAINASVEKAQKDLDALKDVEAELRVTKAELEDTQSQLLARLNDSRQFVTMKKMMQTKSGLLQQLRKRLEIYEPPDLITSADDE